MSKSNYRDQPEIISWDTDFKGSAVYALVDEDGKRYIGQSKHLLRRLVTHRAALRRIRKGEHYYGSLENAKITEAVKNGKTFRVEVLKTFPDVYEASLKQLVYWENYYIEQYGGPEQTYNITYTPGVNPNYEPDNTEITWEEYDKAEKTAHGTIKKEKRNDGPKNIGHISVCLWLNESEKDIYDKLKGSPNKETYVKCLIRNDLLKDAK